MLVKQFESITTAAIAQLCERQTEDLKVPGSIPGLGMLLCKDFSRFVCLYGRTKAWKTRFGNLLDSWDPTPPSRTIQNMLPPKHSRSLSCPYDPRKCAGVRAGSRQNTSPPAAAAPPAFSYASVGPEVPCPHGPSNMADAYTRAFRSRTHRARPRGGGGLGHASPLSNVGLGFDNMATLSWCAIRTE